MRIWVDLTNSPHVLVFRPLFERWRADGHQVEVTARDFAQTLGLCRRFGIEHSEIGRHRGGKIAAKGIGLVSRSLALRQWAKGRDFDLALAHGSNDLAVVAKSLGIPSATMFDYEFARVQHTINCRLARRVIVPDCIPAERLYRYGARGKIAAYEGLKEEYYLYDFTPDPAVLDQLALDPGRSIVVLRTPPEVSLYHRFVNELHAKLVAWLAARGELQVVILPRTREQHESLLARKPDHFIVPSDALDAQSLIFYADLLIGAGGTMNREAVALGTPVYSTFQGRLGAVDESLVKEGRLCLLDDPNRIELSRKQSVAGKRIRRDPQEMAALLLNCF